MIRIPARLLASHDLQRGVALIALLAFIAIAAAVFVVRSLSADTLRTRQDQRTAEALAMAKEALLAFATTNNDRPGSLPCPDIDGDGRSVAGVEYVGQGCAAYIGRLPWALLRIPELRDASGEQLWYALSPNFRDAGALTGNPGFVNPDTAAQLTIAGTAATLVAIVFAPGAALQGQSRAGVDRYQTPNYLDGINATPTTTFVTGQPGVPFNDRLLPITVVEVVALAEQRVVRDAAKALDDYFNRNGFLPSPGLMTNVQCVDAGATDGCAPTPGPLAGRLPANIPAPDTYADSSTGQLNALLRGDVTDPSWLQLQRWREHVIYMVSPECIGPPLNNCASGSLNLRGASGIPVDNARFILAIGGIARPGQQRLNNADKLQIGNYLEGSALDAANLLIAGSVPATVAIPAGTVATASRGP